MKKKEYISPEFFEMHFKLQDVICTSIEDLSSQTNSGSDWDDDGDDEIIGD